MELTPVCTLLSMEFVLCIYMLFHAAVNTHTLPKLYTSNAPVNQVEMLYISCLDLIQLSHLSCLSSSVEEY